MNEEASTFETVAGVLVTGGVILQGVAETSCFGSALLVLVFFAVLSELLVRWGA